MGLFDDIGTPERAPASATESATAPVRSAGLFDDIGQDDTDPTILGTAKQFALGIPRGIKNMLVAGAPAGMAEAIAGSPHLYDTLVEQERQLREQGKETGVIIPTPADYEATAHEQLTRLGIEGEKGTGRSPENAWERVASGAGEGVPWGVVGGVPGMLGNVAVSALGGAGGALAEEFADEKDKPLANVAGNILSAFGIAGALRLGRGLVNLARPMRTLPGEPALPTTKGVLAREDPTLLKHNVTPEMQLQEEEAMSRGARGVAAQKIMERNRVAREAEVARTGEELETGLGGQHVTPEEAGSDVGQSLKASTEGFKSAGDKAYEAAAKKAAWAHADISPSRVIERHLDKESVFLDEFGNHPSSSAAMKVIRKLDAGSGTALSQAETGLVPGARRPIPISVNDMNQARKALGRIHASAMQPEDKRALGVIKNGFDDWEKDMVDNKLFTGDKTVIDDLKTGRDMWRRYHLSKGTGPKQEEYEKILAKVAAEDRTPEQMANYLFNVNTADSAAKAAGLARYIKATFGEESQEMDLLRRAYLHKAMNPDPQAANQSQLAIAKAIESSVNGRGAALARVLYSAEERVRMTRYAAALRRVNPPKFNPPNSGWVNTKHLWGLINAGAGALGLAGGYQAYHTGDMKWLALGTLPFIRSGWNARRALQATTETKPGPSMFPRGAIGSLPASQHLEGRE